MSETTYAWQDAALSSRERAVRLVEAMTLEQKIAQLHGAMETIDIYSIAAQAAESGADMDQLAAQIQIERHVKAIEELGIPRFRITNGPVGVGMGDGTPSPPATSLPMTIGLAAGFDPELAQAYGDIIGSETATLGQHVLEGPGRVPAPDHDRRPQLRVLLRGPVPVRGAWGSPSPRRSRPTT